MAKKKSDPARTPAQAARDWEPELAEIERETRAAQRGWTMEDCDPAKYSYEDDALGGGGFAFGRQCMGSLMRIWCNEEHFPPILLDVLVEACKRDPRLLDRAKKKLSAMRGRGHSGPSVIDDHNLLLIVAHCMNDVEVILHQDDLSKREASDRCRQAEKKMLEEIMSTLHVEQRRAAQLYRQTRRKFAGCKDTMERATVLVRLMSEASSATSST